MCIRDSSCSGADIFRSCVAFCILFNACRKACQLYIRAGDGWTVSYTHLMMGIESCGMLLSAIHEEEGEEKLHLLMVDNHIPAGAKLY